MAASSLIDVGDAPKGPGADWYRDPYGRFEWRFFNGEHWTADVSTAGERHVDSLSVTMVPGTPTGVRAGQRDGRATAAMVLGVVGLVTAWLPFFVVVGVVCAVLALTFGIIALRAGVPAARSFAVAGVITGALAMLVAVVGVLATVAVTRTFNAFTDPPLGLVDLRRCETVDGAVRVGGTLRNVGDERSDYRIVIVSVAPGGTPRRIVVEVEDVAPGTTATFAESAIVSASVDDGATSCRVVEVTGPVPFGLDPDR